MIAVPLVGVVVYLLTQPRWCFLAALFTLPLLTIQFAYIHLFDVFTVLTLGSLMLQRMRYRMPAICLTTGLDWWLIPLGLWLIFKGVTSLDKAAGSLYAVRFGLGFVFYYIVVYALRSQLVSLKTVLMTMLYAVLVQVDWGNVQNWTGLGYLANADWAENNRNYFAFLGIGSKSTQQAFGTFWHFAMFGHFMTASAMFFFPFLLYVVPKQRNWLWLYSSIFWTIVVSYSRGALSAFIAGTGYFCFLFPRKKTRLIQWFQAFFIVLAGMAVYIMVFKDYGKTLSPRDELWSISAYYFDTHPEHFWWGSGVRSLEHTVLNYVPKYIPLGNISQFAPHNFYIMFIHYLGIFGMLFVLAGLGSMLFSTYKEAFWRLHQGFKPEPSPIHLPYKRVLDQVSQWSQARWAWWAVNAGIHLVIVVVLFGGTNDHIFVVDTYLFTWLLVMFALRYAFPWKTHQPMWEQTFTSASKK
jgi:hypothetical protein